MTHEDSARSDNGLSRDYSSGFKFFLGNRAMKRREFLHQSAAAAATVFSAPAILRSAAPNSVLQVASIGVGGMGGATMKGVSENNPKVKIVALCDVDSRTLEAAGKQHPEA